MVVGAFPIAKLSVLLIKQISKPIANVCKERAKNSPFFRTYVCMPPAQFYNWCEVKAKMWILNLGKPVNIPVLSQEMAIELGANLLGETVIFVIGAGLLVIEYSRQSKKESAKEAKREAEMNHISSTIVDLFFTVQQQQTQIREMERLIHAIGDSKPIPPPPPPSQSGKPPATPVTPTPHPGNISQLVPPGKVSYSDKHSNGMPYPNNGIILQSLNYIQMDAFSSLFPLTTSQVRTESDSELTKDKAIQQKSDPAIISAALHNIENNFKSLF